MRNLKKFCAKIFEQSKDRLEFQSIKAWKETVRNLLEQSDCADSVQTLAEFLPESNRIKSKFELSPKKGLCNYIVSEK